MQVPLLGGGGGSAMTTDGVGAFIFFREESIGEIAGWRIGTSENMVRVKYLIITIVKLVKKWNVK